MKHASALGLAIALATSVAAQTTPSTVAYRCPGNLYTDQLTAKEAADKGCKVIEGQPVTVIQGNRPRPSAGPGSAVPRIDANEQKQRDVERRSILEAELRRDEDKLAELKREYNNGEPERLGTERNYQRYIDRVAELKAGIARKESDIASLKREIGKLP